MTPDIKKRILITGASSGIGQALAECYAAPDTELLLTGRDGARLRATALACSARGASVHYMCADIRDAALIHQWMVENDRRGPIDLVIANAGISAGSGLEDETWAQAQMVFDVNVGGVLNTIHPLIPRMKERRSGQIVIISSLAAFSPWPRARAYAASKATVKTYGLAMRIALAPFDIKVNVVCPGFIDTPMTRVNPYTMPWIMDARSAARIIKDGLDRDRALIAFPWQMSLIARGIGMLPFWIQKRILAKAPAKPALPPE